MNSRNMTKRSVGSTSPTSSSHTKISSTSKRVKRIRRKPKRNKSFKSNFLLPLLLGLFLSLLLICVTYLITSNLKNEPKYGRQLEQDERQDEQERQEHHNHHHPNRLREEREQEQDGRQRHHQQEEEEKENRKHERKRKHNMNMLEEENEPPPKISFLQSLRDSHGKYRHSDYLNQVGDHSTAYTQLRREYDGLLPLDDTSTERMRNYVQNLKKNTYKNLMAHEMSYDIHNCPEYPPPNYPFAWNVKDVLDNWPPDDTFKLRTHIYQGLCVFDYETEKDKALNYREAEVPFVVQNDPKVLRTVERWNQPDYMLKMLGGQTAYRTERSHNNHFMYWNRPGKKQQQAGGVPENWKPPTKMTRMRFPKWVAHANVTDEELLQPDHEHWYLRLIGCGEMGECDKDSSEYLFDELGFFQPTEENDLYMVEPRKQKGIHCRFGMKGVIAENHFDGSRNMIAVLGGERRYILSHPDQCNNLALFPRGHPSARHSAVDWSDPNWDEFPDFAEAEVNEVVMQAGDVLYLPTNWFHYIISLDLNYQCNTRSGVNHEYMDAIHDCGF